MKAKEERPRTFLRRIGAALVAMCIMSLSFVTGVMAATTSYAQTINFTGVKNGDSITAYRLVSYNDSYNDYVFNGKFGNYIDQYVGENTRAKYLSTRTNAQMGSLISGYAAAAQTVDGEYAPIVSTDDSLKATAGESEIATLSLDPGYYMILGSTIKENSVLYSPTCVFIKPEGSTVKVYAGASGTDITAETTRNVAMKTETAPTLDKKSKNPDHANEDWKTEITSQVGDTVDFRIQVDIPAFSDGTKLNLTVKDTMTNMVFVPSTVKVYSDAACTTEIEGAAPESGIKTEEYGATTEHKQNISIDLDFDKVHPTADSASTIYVFYQAEIHEDSSVDNVDAENVAKLVYSNQAMPDVSYDTDDSKTDVDLFEIKLYKRDETGANALAGAKFTLYEGTSTTAMKFAQKENGDYYPSTSGSITEVACDSDGYLHIVGLDEGTYKVQETTVPTGYYAPSDAFTLKLVRSAKNTLDSINTSFTAINSADDGLIMTDKTKITPVTNDKNETVNNIYEIYLKNSVTPTLPTAGGMGTVIFTIVGLAMMTGACLILFARRKNTDVR
jgi:LPXTG-motif cell wall-anchored protein